METETKRTRGEKMIEIVPTNGMVWVEDEDSYQWQNGDWVPNNPTQKGQYPEAWKRGKTMTKLVEEVDLAIAQAWMESDNPRSQAETAIAKVFDWLEEKSKKHPYSVWAPVNFLSTLRKEALGEEK